jgi:hypothetical protein
MGKTQWQHYLPQSFLRGFATSSGEVWRYDRLTKDMKLLPPKVIGAEQDLYTLVTGEEVSHEIENEWFSPLDGSFLPILRKIQSKERLSVPDVFNMANFVAYLRVRTPASIRESEMTMKHLDSLCPDGRDSVKYHSESKPSNPESIPESFVLTQERADDVDASHGDPLIRNEVLRMLVSNGMTLSNGLIQLEWSFLFAARGRAFVVGDNPFVVAPPLDHDVELTGVGPLTPGAAAFVPLSRETCVRLTSPGNSRSLERRVGSDEVRAINACQVLNSERFIFSHDENLLRRVVSEFAKTSGLNLAKAVMREAVNDRDDLKSLVHFFTRSKIGAEWALRLPMD